MPRYVLIYFSFNELLTKCSLDCFEKVIFYVQMRFTFLIYDTL